MKPASVPLKDRFGLLNRDPCLLTASFEINGSVYRVIVDTGATVSFIPEFGAIMRSNNARIENANLNVQLGNNEYSHINQKVVAFVRPTGPSVPVVEAPLYVTNGHEKILDHEALFGLNILKHFDLDICTRNGRILVFHKNKCIGFESESEIQKSASMKVDERLEHLELDPNLAPILRRFKGVFTDISHEPIRGRPMRILTTHQRPIFAKTRHYTKEETLQMKEHIETLLKNGIIEPTNSGYASTSRIILKKNGQSRLVINYIPLNAVTLRDSYSVPQVADILAIAQGNQYFSTLDCTQGFYQILVHPRDRHKTAFSTSLGNFQFIRCPFGARNSSAYFQSEMNRIFMEGLSTKCVVYVDDILVFGRTRNEHDQNLAWVLQKCNEHNVKLKLEKCKFAQQTVEYLGFTISGKTIRPLESRIDLLSNTKPPSDKTELRSIIGKLNFYSRFIPQYSKLLEPLRGLFRKNTDFQWKESHQSAFDKLVKALKAAEPLYLVSREDHKTIELTCLGNSIESVLLTDDGRLISRSSRLLGDSEANYSLTEKYLLALVEAMDKFRIWIHPERFKIRIPTNELEKAMKLVNKPERLNNLLLRMPEGFDTFTFELGGVLPKQDVKRLRDHIPEDIYYVDGACKRNGQPDCIASWAVCSEFDRDLQLVGFVEDNPSNNSAEVTAAIKACEYAKSIHQESITIVTDSRYLHSAATKWIDKWINNQWQDYKRKPLINTELFQKLLYAKQGLNIEWIHVKGHADSAGNIRADLLAKSLLEHNTEQLCAAITFPRTIQEDSEEVYVLKQMIQDDKVTGYTIEDDTIYWIDKKTSGQEYLRIYVPATSRKFLLHLAHDNLQSGGHLGINKTYRKLFNFWWPKMYSDVEEYVKSCDVCQRFKEPAGLPPGYLHSMHVSSAFERLHIDIVGPIRSTWRGNCYIITATDAFSKWAFAKPVQQAKTSDIIEFVKENIISIHGAPKIIRSDQGSQFKSAEWKQFLKEIGSELSLTCPYSPQANGIDERLNGTLVRILRTYVADNQDDWDTKLMWALYVYNTTVHDSTGFSPYQILHGMEPRTPLSDITHPRSNNLHTMSIEEARNIARARNEEAQSNQAKIYNSKHRQTDLKLGQLVLIRNNAVPTDLSKKLYPKWYGPVLIIGFIGDKSSPKAVKIWNPDLNKSHTVSVRHVKPYYSREEDASTDFEIRRRAEEMDLYASKYYCDDPVENEPVVTGDNENNDYNPRLSELTFDPISRINDTGLICSSPKRVTINDNVQCRYFEPTDTNTSGLDDTISSNSDMDTTLVSETSYANDTTLVQDRSDSANVTVIENTTDSADRSNNTSYISPYLEPLWIENERADPTYTPPANVSKAINSNNKANETTNITNTPRYELRPRKRLAYFTQAPSKRKRVEAQVPSLNSSHEDLQIDNPDTAYQSNESNATNPSKNDTTNSEEPTVYIENLMAMCLKLYDHFHES